jgi:hypothetical protein
MRARLYQQEAPVMFRCPVTFAGSADMAILGFGRRRPPEPGKHIVPPELWDDPENAAFSLESAQSRMIPAIFASRMTMW